MVVRVRPVSLGRKDLAIGIIPVVVGALALVLGQPRHAPPTIQVIPVGLALRARREVPHLQKHRGGTEGLHLAPCEHRLAGVNPSNSQLLRTAPLLIVQMSQNYPKHC